MTTRFISPVEILSDEHNPWGRNVSDKRESATAKIAIPTELIDVNEQQQYVRQKIRELTPILETMEIAIGSDASADGTFVIRAREIETIRQFAKMHDIQLFDSVLAEFQTEEDG